MNYKNPYKTLKKIFSEYIRLRDSKNGICICISCGRPVPIKECHAGHFISVGKSKALEFEELNVNAECESCNVYNSDHLIGYANNLIKKYGPDIIDRLNRMKTSAVRQRKNYEYEALIQLYKLRIKKLK